MPQLLLKELICHQRQGWLFKDKIRLKVWGSSNRPPYLKSEDGVTNNDRIPINETLEFDNQALVFLVDEDKFDPNDILGGGVLTIAANPIVNGSLRFTTKRADYELVYEVTQPRPSVDVEEVQVEEASPVTSDNLIIKSVVCLGTADGKDKLQLQVRKDDRSPHEYKFDMKKGTTKELNAIIPVNDADMVQIKLIEQDLGKHSLINPDDIVGTNNYLIRRVSNDMLEFRSGRAHYILICDVQTRDLNKEHDLFVVPKLAAGNDGNTSSVWIGSFSGAPSNVTWRLYDNGDQLVKSGSLITASWTPINLPFGPSNIFCNTVNFTGLVPATQYRFVASQTRESKEARFRTMPESIPVGEDKAFTTFLGSCYESEYDVRRVSAAFRRVFSERNPDLLFLAGDQVYLDHPMTVFATQEFSPDELQRQFVFKYRQSWSALHPVMSSGVNVQLADDHEVFNNTPFPPLVDSRLIVLGRQNYLDAWCRIAKPLYYEIQGYGERNKYLCRKLNIGTDLSFFFANTRIERDSNRKRLLPAADFKMLLDWIRDLKSPGVLIINEPLILEDGKYANTKYEDYKLLIQAIVNSEHPHDIVVMSGDVHFSRFAEVAIPSASRMNRKLYEVISSPLSLIESDPRKTETDLIEFAAIGHWDPEGEDVIRRFPPEFLNGPEFSPAQNRPQIEYLKTGPERRVVGQQILRKKVAKVTAEENFAKVRFFKQPDQAGIQMKVNVHMQRQPDETTGETGREAWEHTTTLR